MKSLFLKISLFTLLIIQISVLAQRGKADLSNLVKVRIPLTGLPPGTSQNYSQDSAFFPSDPRNIWQYWEATTDYQTTPYVKLNYVLSDTVMSGKVYQYYGMCRWIRYDHVERKLFGWANNSDQLIADFSIEKPGVPIYPTMSFYGNMGSYFYHNYPATIEVLGEPREVRAFWYEGYGSSGVVTDEEYAKGIGAYYLYFVSWGHGNIIRQDYRLRQAKIYDDTGVTLYYTPTDKPVISFTRPPSQIDTSVLKKSVKIRHPYNKKYTWNLMPKFYNFIDSAIIEGYYSNGFSLIPAPSQRLVFEPLADSSMINYQLNDSLLRAGYEFNYRFIAIDRSIIPQSDTLPKNGYFSVNYPAVGIKDNPMPEIGYELEQNYPNPFSTGDGSDGGLTAINYTLSQAGQVKGVVYDLLGSEVATLIDGEMPRGTHSIKFDGRGLSPGVYIFRITAGGMTKAIKMVLGR